MNPSKGQWRNYGLKYFWSGVWTFFFLSVSLSSHGGHLDTIGVTLLRQIDSSLKGAGVRVAQPESRENTNMPPAFEVSPSAVGQPVSLFTYISTNGTANTYPNSVGAHSFHADGVAAAFYGLTTGVAPEIDHVDSYDADYFIDAVIDNQVSIPGTVVNQSFIFGNISISTQRAVDSLYDDYAATFNTLFLSGAGNGTGSGNGGFINAPATCYNGIGVGASDGPTSIGTTRDNGRCKPDIVAPGGYTSFSTPYVAGAAAILIQAGARNDGGLGTSIVATNIPTIKALLLNGAVKPANWTNGISFPLDARYGAGILNLFNSYKQLAAGKYSFIDSTSNPIGGAHPPTSNTNNVSSLTGWNFTAITNNKVTGIYQEQIHHYYFDLSTATASPFTLTASLVWNRQIGETNINDLDLYLYDVSNTNLISSSISGVNNVEHLFCTNLPAGRYDLQVVKNASSVELVTEEESYALAFEFFSVTLNISRSGNNVVISWPIAPTGFILESTLSLNPPIVWNPVATPVVVTNNFSTVTLNASSGNQFFRLRRP